VPYGRSGREAANSTTRNDSVNLRLDNGSPTFR